ncbi:hypothetical protein G7Y79_00073g098140 [Physcia stellaris]|nr:hypothetical protein G7Y79_00073g098140 [Physcia stellaris]
MKPLTLEKLYGKYILKLAPAIGALRVFDPSFDCDLEYAATDSTAIFYPDAHPSDDQVYTSEQLFPSSDAGKDLAEIHPSNDDKLRRFAALGYILQENSQKQWRKTGHVLVMDMDDRKYRKRQPWLVLAPAWPTDGYETATGEFTHRAPHTVVFGSSGEYGVLPEGRNRTPIASIIAMDESQRDKIVLEQFGENFHFVPDRRGGHRRSKPSNKGPALAEAMNWYWDPVLQREVCFGDGMEYMHFNPETQSYSFPDFSKTKIKGMNGIFGSLEEEADLEAGEVEAPADKNPSVATGGMTTTRVYPPERHRLSTTSPAF